MHPALHTRNLSKLDPSIHPLALSAANGSVEALVEICMSVFSRTPPTAQDAEIWLLLPIFYIHLDLSKIPTPNEVDDIVANQTSLPCIRGACMALRAFCEVVELPVFSFATATDIWVRAWPWMDFLHTYWDCLPKFDQETEIHACFRHSCIIAKLRGNFEETRDLIRAQDGVRLIFARTWGAVVLDGIDIIQGPVLLDAAGALLPMLSEELEVPANFEAVLDGVGGLERLAAVFVKHIAIALEGITRSLALNVYSISSLVAALVSIRKKPECVSVLLSHKIVTSIVTILLDFERPGRQKVAAQFDLNLQIKDSCWDLIAHYTAIAPGFPWIAEAIEAGVLRSVIYSTAIVMQDRNDERHHMKHVAVFMFYSLPWAFVSQAVLKRTKKAIVDAQDLLNRRDFIEWPFYYLWEKVIALLNARIAVLENWEAAGRPSFMACDNMLCGRIIEKSKFKRCAGCAGANYCSGDCQSIDWRNGHRSSCDNLRVARIRYPELVHPRERSFIHALVQHDYERLLFDISLRQIKFMREHPGKVFIVTFNYAMIQDVAVEVVLQSKLLGEMGVVRHLEAELPIQRERRARSGQRMTLHAVAIAEGQWVKIRLFPLRASSAEFQIGLREIAKASRLGPDTAELDERAIRTLILETEGLTVIH
ncbi:hypothetical protein C8R46DRAFT_1143817 [Mycena filopes]|nr:hypothetical protein C8R46DRAFT_1143817 [Mycena filopes]